MAKHSYFAVLFFTIPKNVKESRESIPINVYPKIDSKWYYQIIKIDIKICI